MTLDESFCKTPSRLLIKTMNATVLYALSILIQQRLPFTLTKNTIFASYCF